LIGIVEIVVDGNPIPALNVCNPVNVFVVFVA
jgi:hypothetical protein